MSIPLNITSEHISLAIKEIDEKGVPENRESTKFYLSFEGILYPPKYVISLANKHANGQELSPVEFSGGSETNDFFAKLGFEIVDNQQVESHSWTILNSQTVNKVLDKSAFLHRGTGIPVEIRSFFNIQDMNVGDKKEVTLVVGTKNYDAYLSKSRNERTRLFWYKKFAQKLGHEFGTFTDRANGKKPIMKFERSESNETVYYVSLSHTVDEDTVQLDIHADEIENEVLHEFASNKEGAIKQYYGKRYERNPKNRKLAIELHGTVCVACGFDFEKVYGERGKDFIEIHHTMPLSMQGGKETFVDPLTDLVPVCSNCHRMIHRRYDNVLTIEQLKEILQTVKS